MGVQHPALRLRVPRRGRDEPARDRYRARLPARTPVIHPVCLELPAHTGPHPARDANHARPALPALPALPGGALRRRSPRARRTVHPRRALVHRARARARRRRARRARLRGTARARGRVRLPLLRRARQAQEEQAGVQVRELRVHERPAPPRCGPPARQAEPQAVRVPGCRMVSIIICPAFGGAPCSDLSAFAIAVSSVVPPKRAWATIGAKGTTRRGALTGQCDDVCALHGVY